MRISLKLIIGVALLGILFYSCNNTETENPYENQVLIKSLEIADQKGVVGLRVSNDTIYFKNQLIGLISKENIVKNGKGEILAVWEKDILSDSKNNPIASIDSSGRISNGSGMEFFWSNTGTLMRGSEKTGFTIKPVNSTLFKYASIIYMLQMSFDISVDNKLTNSKFQDTIYIKIDKNLVVTFNNKTIATSNNNEPNTNLINNLLLDYLKREYSDTKRLPSSIFYKTEDKNARVLFSSLDDAISTVQSQMISFIEKEENITDKMLIKKYPVLLQKKFY